MAAPVSLCDGVRVSSRSHTGVRGSARYDVSSTPSGLFLIVDAKAQHHAAFDVLGDMAVRHPDSGIGHVHQELDRLTRSHQHCILPGQVRVLYSIAARHQKALTVDVERM